MSLICITGLITPSKYLIEIPFFPTQAETEAQKCMTCQGHSVHKARESRLLPCRSVPGSMQLSPAVNLGHNLVEKLQIE